MVNNQALDAVFFALADPTRRRIVEKLTKRSLTVGEIAGGFDMTAPAISKHVKVLERCGLLKRAVRGREHHCTLDARAMRTASGWLARQERYWNEALDNLHDYLEKVR